MAKENILWDQVKVSMSNLWDAQRHEDKYSVGIPDVSFGINDKNGWIELKYLEKWPKYGTVKIPHFTSQQRNWLERRDGFGGGCWLLLQVGNDYLIFRGVNVLEVGFVDRGRLEDLAHDIYCHGPDSSYSLKEMVYRAITR